MTNEKPYTIGCALKRAEGFLNYANRIPLDTAHKIRLFAQQYLLQIQNKKIEVYFIPVSNTSEWRKMCVLDVVGEEFKIVETINEPNISYWKVYVETSVNSYLLPYVESFKNKTVEDIDRLITTDRGVL